MKSAELWALDTAAELSPTELIAVARTVEAVREEMRVAIRDHLRQRGFNADRDGLPTYGRHLIEAASIIENFGKDAK